MIQPNYYGILPANVRYDKNLSPMEKIMYTEITALMQKEGYCYANNRYFADLYSVHKDTASGWINSLEKYGFISINIIYKNNSKEVFQRRITPIGENTDTYRQKDLYPIGENTEDNNTSINTTRGHPSEEQVIKEAERQKIDRNTAIKFYLHYEAMGWRRVNDFVPLLRKWNMNELNNKQPVNTKRKWG